MHWGVAGRTCGARVGFDVVVGMVLLACGFLWHVVVCFCLNSQNQKVKPPKILEKNDHSTKKTDRKQSSKMLGYKVQHGDKVA